MKAETLAKFQGKKVRIFLSNGRLYNGIVQKVEDDCLEMIDKFNLDVVISIGVIQQVEVINEQVKTEA